jgi:hypothetical protein
MKFCRDHKNKIDFLIFAINSIDVRYAPFWTPCAPEKESGHLLPIIDRIHHPPCSWVTIRAVEFVEIGELNGHAVRIFVWTSDSKKGLQRNV